MNIYDALFLLMLHSFWRKKKKMRVIQVSSFGYENKYFPFLVKKLTKKRTFRHRKKAESRESPLIYLGFSGLMRRETQP